MLAIQGQIRFEEIARRWLNLAERRLRHITELHSNGRWRHYYTEEHLVMRMQDAIKAVTIWRQLAALPSLPEVPAAADARRSAA